MEAKISITNGTRSVSIEGTEDFVLNQIEEFRSVWEAPNSQNAPVQSTESQKTVVTAQQTKSSGLPETFGEYLSQFPRDINQDEQILIAGYFAQKQSEDDGFSTSEANDLLKEQGIKVGNASQSVTNNKNAKRVFALQKGKYRVGKPGAEHIEKLLGG